MIDLAALEADTRALLASDRVTAPTRKALLERLDRRYGAPKTFTPDLIAILRGVCSTLLPDYELVERVALAEAFDAHLADGLGDGWRHSDLPPDPELHEIGLRLLDCQARYNWGLSFCELDGSGQWHLMNSLSLGRPFADNDFDTKRWFEELMSALVELYYSHPLVQRSIGYDGMADAFGWQAVGLAEVAAETRAGG